MFGSSLVWRGRVRMFRNILRHPTAYQFVLNIFRYEEAAGAELLAAILPHLRDAELARRIERHRDDELRHASMFAAHIESLGGVCVDPPSDVRLLELLRAAQVGIDVKRLSGGAPLDDANVVRFLAAAFVEEENAFVDFELNAAASEGDAPRQSIFASIRDDELRHRAYLDEQLRRYEEKGFGSEITRLLRDYRRTYRRVDMQLRRRVIGYLIDSRGLPAPLLPRWFFHILPLLHRISKRHVLRSVDA